MEKVFLELMDVVVDDILFFDEYSYDDHKLDELRIFLRIGHIVFQCENFDGHANRKVLKVLSHLMQT
jgi:hypothetical protein